MADPAPGKRFPTGKRRKTPLSPEEREARRRRALERAITGDRVATRKDGTVVIGARGYSWEPFKPGNTAAQTHGAGTKGRPKEPTQAVVRLSEEIEDVARRHLEGACPEQLRMPQFAPAVRSWSRLEARTQLLSEWLDRLLAEGGVEAWATPQKSGAVKTPFELWMAAERASAKARKDLGLDPASWASIQRDLGFAQKNQADALTRLGQQGAQIRAQREAAGHALPAPQPEEDETGDGQGA